MSDWLIFEQSVAAFLQSLDPSSKVTHNAKLPDRDSGTPRQRDVWIETSFGGHVKFNILVSCKKYRRRVNIQDMDAFVGELRSSGAAIGVLYSYSGFSDSALTKARVLGISCCSLIARKEILPESLPFNIYYYRTSYNIKYTAKIKIDPPEIVRLMRMASVVGGIKRGIIPDIARMYNSYVSERIKVTDDYCFDKEVIFSATMNNVPVAERFSAIVTVGWQVYKAARSAFFESGSYNFVDRHFAGIIDGPSIDPQTADPLGSWEMLQRPLPAFDNKWPPISVLTMAGDIAATIDEGLAEVFEAPMAKA